jgi:hypothetical protein
MRSENTQMRTPTVLSNTFVIKYHRHVSELGSSNVNNNEINRFMK